MKKRWASAGSMVLARYRRLSCTTVKPKTGMGRRSVAGAGPRNPRSGDTSSVSSSRDSSRRLKPPWLSKLRRSSSNRARSGVRSSGQGTSTNRWSAVSQRRARSPACGRVHDVDGLDDVGELRGFEPRAVAIEVLLRGTVPRRGRAHLQGAERARDLGVECVAELDGGVRQVPLHALPLGRAQLTDPAGYWDTREGRKQDEQDGR